MSGKDHKFVEWVEMTAKQKSSSLNMLKVGRGILAPILRHPTRASHHLHSATQLFSHWDSFYLRPEKTFEEQSPAKSPAKKARLTLTPAPGVAPKSFGGSSNAGSSSVGGAGSSNSGGGLWDYNMERIRVLEERGLAQGKCEVGLIVQLGEANNSIKSLSHDLDEKEKKITTEAFKIENLEEELHLVS